jgi:hypothetical protein
MLVARRREEHLALLLDGAETDGEITAWWSSVSALTASARRSGRLPGSYFLLLLCVADSVQNDVRDVIIRQAVLDLSSLPACLHDA